jgi:hypothetical protein
LSQQRGTELHSPPGLNLLSSASSVVESCLPRRTQSREGIMSTPPGLGSWRSA